MDESMARSGQIYGPQRATLRAVINCDPGPRRETRLASSRHRLKRYARADGALKRLDFPDWRGDN
jgi:hypothetical protein